MPKYTAQEQRILEALKDGESHPPDDLYACLQDDCAGDRENLRKNLIRALWDLRTKMQPTGLLIISEWNRRRAYYRLARRFKGFNEE